MGGDIEGYVGMHRSILGDVGMYKYISVYLDTCKNI